MPFRGSWSFKDPTDTRAFIRSRRPFSGIGIHVLDIHEGEIVSLRVVRIIALCVLSASVCLPRAVLGKGAASGRVAIIDGSTKAFGFSSSVGSWSSVTLDSALQSKLVGSYIGYLRTERKFYAFNSTTNAWYSTPIIGRPIGEDAQGATAVAWTDQACFGISTVWVLWRSIQITMPIGGGSGGNYALVWTESAAHAYSSSSGQWSTQALTSLPLGGYASPGLGLVWTSDSVCIYDPVARCWNVLTIEDPEGVSVSGSGKVGIVWSASLANAYSAYLAGWSSLPGTDEFLGGAAGEEVAILWSSDHAFAFDAPTGSWVPIDLEVLAAAPGSIAPDGAFSLAPNPTTGPLSIRLPAADHPWRIEIVNLEGARIRSLESPPSSAGAEIVWDQRDDQDRPVSSGTYWVRAHAGERVEARRFVLLR